MNEEVKVLDMTHADEVIREVDGGAAPTMQSRMGTGGNQVPLVMGVFNQQGSKGTGHASTEDTSPTLGHCNTSVDVHAVCLDGNKLCKNERAGGSGLGVSDDEVSYTETANDIHAVAVGFSHVASGMMLDCQPSPTSVPLKRSPGGEGAVCVGVDTYNQSISPNVMHTLHHHDGLDNQPKVCLGFKAGQSANGGLGEEAEVSPTMSHQPSALEPTVAFAQNTRDEIRLVGGDGQNAGALAAEPGMKQQTYVALRHIVRRLTPTECERLQAFPDGWTRIPYRGKPADQCPDSPRYKALGNSWATNCAEWILRRIVAAVRLGMI